MYGVALRMLFGDRAKYLGLIFGVAFATLLITQQSALFVGLMQRTVNVIDDAPEADLWIMSPETRYVERVRPLRDTAPARVRGWRASLGRCRFIRRPRQYARGRG